MTLVCNDKDSNILSGWGGGTNKQILEDGNNTLKNY